MNPIQKNIERALEIDKLSPREQEEIILRVGALIYHNVLIRVMEIMSEANQKEFEKLLDQNPQPSEIFTFLKNKIENFEAIIEEEALKFKNKAINIMDQIGD